MAESETEQQIDASATPAIASIVRPIDVWPAEWAGEIARAASQSLFDSITQPLREFERLKVDLIRQSLAFERLRMPTKYLEEVLGQQRQAQALIDALNVSSWLTWPVSPRRRPYTPERPPGRIEAVEIADLDSRAILTALIREGKATPAEMIRTGLEFSDKPGPGPKLPPWSEIEAICLDYERSGHKYPNQESFAARHNISKGTFTRYRRLWRAARQCKT